VAGIALLPASMAKRSKEIAFGASMLTLVSRSSTR
jgi:hypothetical protein